MQSQTLFSWVGVVVNSINLSSAKLAQREINLKYARAVAGTKAKTKIISISHLGLRWLIFGRILLMFQVRINKHNSLGCKF